MQKIMLVFIAMFLLVGITAAQENTTYTVQRGDTLTAIADRFDIELDALLIVNNLVDPNRIRVGLVLIIPTGAVAVPRSHVVQAGERMIDIAIRYNTTVDAIVAVNGLSDAGRLATGQVLQLPPMGGPVNFAQPYIVDIGDTLRNIATRFGTTWQTLAAYNNIVNPNRIDAGLRITIPPANWVAPAPVVTVTPTPTFGTGGPFVPVVQFPRQVVNGVYTVQAGDTLFAVAASFGVNVYAVAQANGILNLNDIYVGQGLVIP